MMKKGLCLLALFFCAVLPLAAQGPAAQNLRPAPEYELEIIDQKAPQTVPFAQPFALEFALSRTPGYAVDLDKETLPEGFAVTQINVTENSPGTVTYDLTAVPFRLGVSTFTAVTFNLVDANKKVLSSAQSEDMPVTVTPVKYFNDQEIKEIRPPFIPANLLAWLLVILLLGVLVFVVRHFFKNAQLQARTVNKTEDKRPSNVIALSKIEALLQSGLWEQQEYKLFYITLSDIFREYLWRRFHLDTSSDTSAELLRRVKNMPQMAPLMYQVRDFVSTGDLVKFAKVIPTEQERNKDVRILKEIVQETAPKEITPEDLTPGVKNASPEVRK